MINSDDTKYGGTGVLNESEIRSHKKPFLDFAVLRGDNAPADELRLLPLYPQQTRARSAKSPPRARNPPPKRRPGK